MIDVLGVTFKENGKIYYFEPNNQKFYKRVTVIVETERGLQFAKVETDIITIDRKRLNNKLNKIIRISTKQDYIKHLSNIKLAKEALEVSRELVEKNNLKMKIIDSNFTFDRNQLQFHFLADSRIDFRDLARELAAIYRTRIDLRQIGVRDKAREIGGYGTCGRKLCCALFLDNLDNVTINMAKNQNLSLNPSKINGSCGRLLCCLKYEDNDYSKCRECLPKIGEKIKTEKGYGKVISLDLINKTYKVDVPKEGIIVMDKVKNGCS